MFENEEDLFELLDFLQLDYEIDSPTPGIRSKTGEFIPYDNLKLPSEYFEELSYQTYSINLISKVGNENKTVTKYHPTLRAEKINKEICSSNFRMEFAA